MNTNHERLGLWSVVARRRWALVVGVLALALVGLGVGGAAMAKDGRANGERAQEARPTEQAMTVRLIIDFNNGAQRVYTRLAWTKGMTVLDALRQASEHPQGFALNVRGGGETAFITMIDGVTNERGGGESRNWLYWVNTEFATRSAGVMEVQPGDVVLWKYERLNAARGE